MTFSNIIDTHTHSNNSFDGNNTCCELCEGIIKNGGIGIAITDHCDIDGIEDCFSYQEKQFCDVSKAKEKYKNRISVYHGIELGQGIYRKELSEKLLSSYDFDIVIGSIHNLENEEDFYFLDYSKVDIDEILNRYFQAILEMCKWNKVDTVAHLTYPLRYIVAREHINVDISKFDNIISEIFTEIIKNEMALELNVSGLSMEMNDTLPNKELIKKYHDMGGKYVTVGSDSHYAEKVCLNIKKGYDILRECGFEHITIFEKRKAILIPIK